MQKKPVVKKNAKGVWCCRLYLGRDNSGKSIQPYASFPIAKDEADAQAMAELWAKNLTADGRVKSANLVELLWEYIAIRKQNGVSPNTVRQYRGFVKNHVGALLGHADARSLNASDFTAFEQRLMRSRREGGHALSRNSTINVHHFLRGAYGYFVAAGICDTNPLINAAKPSPERHEAISLEEYNFAELDQAVSKVLQEAFAASEYTAKTVYAFAAWLALRTGLRCGEVCALNRKDINRLQGFIHVGGTVIEEPRRKSYRRDVTKGRKCRNVSITEEDMRTITRYIDLQTRALATPSWDLPLISLDGSYMRPSNVSRAFSSLRRSLKLPKGITFHTLRHTHATWCLASGVDLKTLSERLGHADEATTLRLYAHVLPGRDRAAAEAFEGAVKRVSVVFNLAC